MTLGHIALGKSAAHQRVVLEVNRSCAETLFVVHPLRCVIMSESGHSQPGMYGQGRRRRRRRGERESGIPGQNLSGPSRDRDYYPRERRVNFLRPPKMLLLNMMLQIKVGMIHC